MNSKFTFETVEIFFSGGFKMGGGQNLEQLNVEWPIFWISDISNIKRTKDESFDFIIFDLKKKFIFV